MSRLPAFVTQLILLLAILKFTRCGREADSPRPLFLPDDLEVTLWAESPMFYNPTNMDVDSKGRIWIAEAVNYRSYNNDSTTRLHHSEGDRIVILEDSNQDGKADRSIIYVQDKDLISPLGIAVIGNKVFVSCSPHLIVYTDDDGDDKPDHKEIFLTGFGGFDHDHSLHALVGGPDGKLYFNTGNAGPHIVRDKSGWTLRSGSIYTGGSPYNNQNQGNMKSDDGKVWVGGMALRINPDGTGLKVMAHNFRNAYELFIDSNGDMWQNDNDDQVVTCRTTWLMEGGNAGYFSTDGTRFWQADQRPGQDMFTAHWHQEDPGVMPAGDNTGAGSPTGVVVNESDALGEHYRGMLLSAEAGRNVIFGYHPKQSASGYELGNRTNLITSVSEDNRGYVWNDSSVIADHHKWFRPSDIAFGTEGALYIADWYDPIVGGHQMLDTIGYGRIYRITPRHKKLTVPKLDLSHVKGQIEALKSPAVNVRHAAFEKLRDQGESVIPEVKEVLKDKNPYHKARAIWLLSQLGQTGKAETVKLLSDPDEHIRLVAFRALRQVSDDILPHAKILIRDPSPFVRREIMIALHDTPFELVKPLLEDLIAGYDGHDRWYLETLGSLLTNQEENIYHDILQMFDADKIEADQWNPALASLVWRLHPPASVDALKKRAASPVLSEKERREALTALGFINTPSAVNAMMALSKNDLRDVAEQAIYWLSFRQSNEWYSLIDWKKTGIDPERERRVAMMKVQAAKVLNEELPTNEKKWTIQRMAKDPIGGSMLLDMSATGSIPEELWPIVGQYIFDNPEQAIRVRASLYFKKPGAASQYAIPEILKKSPDLTSGEQTFLKSCNFCHRYNSKGGNIGPDLTGIKKKLGKEAMLDAIINPSAGIVFGYEAWTIKTYEDTWLGFLVADGSKTVVLNDLSGQRHVIPTASILSRQKQDKSMMPEPSGLGLSEKDLADIIGYLSEVR